MNYNNITSETYNKMDIAISEHDNSELVVQVRYCCSEIEMEWENVYGLSNAENLAKSYIDRMEKDGKLDKPHCSNEYCQQAHGIFPETPVSKSSDVTLELQPVELGLYQIYVGSESPEVTLFNWFTMSKDDLSRFKVSLDKLSGQIRDVLLQDISDILNYSNPCEA